MRSTFSMLEEKAQKINQDFLAKRAEESKQTKIVDFLKTKLGNRMSSLSKLETQKLTCILEGLDTVDSKAEVYYCTSEGRVYGEL
jgi:hypothetical protein